MYFIKKYMLVVIDKFLIAIHNKYVQYTHCLTLQCVYTVHRDTIVWIGGVYRKIPAVSSLCKRCLSLSATGKKSSSQHASWTCLTPSSEGHCKAPLSAQNRRQNISFVTKMTHYTLTLRTLPSSHEFYHFVFSSIYLVYSIYIYLKDY